MGYNVRVFQASGDWGEAADQLNDGFASLVVLDLVKILLVASVDLLKTNRFMGVQYRSSIPYITEAAQSVFTQRHAHREAYWGALSLKWVVSDRSWSKIKAARENGFGK